MSLSGDEPSPPGEAEALELLGRLYSENRPMTVELQARDVFIMASTIQLAMRHPGMSEGAVEGQLMSLARMLTDRLEEIEPGARAVLDMGWNPELDQPRSRARGVRWQGPPTS